LTLIVALTTVLRTTVLHCDKPHQWRLQGGMKQCYEYPLPLGQTAEIV